jgi:hypothetical protein
MTGHSSRRRVGPSAPTLPTSETVPSAAPSLTVLNLTTCPNPHPRRAARPHWPTRWPYRTSDPLKTAHSALITSDPTGMRGHMSTESESPTPSRKSNTETTRLFSKVSYKTDDLACWEFTGYRDPDGYGRIYWRGRSGYLAHRAAYELAYGQIPEGLTVDHTCYNRACIRYEHLEAVPHAENVRRAAERRTPRTHCGNGHEYTEASTYWHRGGRHCRVCNRLASRRYSIRKRSAATRSPSE